jgi:hypothetical protein
VAGRSGKTALARLRDALFDDDYHVTPQQTRNLGDPAPAVGASRRAHPTEPGAAQPEVAPPSVSTEELLDRLERQAAAIVRVCSQLRANQEWAAAQRKTRQEGRPDSVSGRDATDVERRLAEANEKNRLLEQQVEVAWLQLGALEAELGAKHSRGWRRLFERRRSTLPPAS